LQEIAKKDKIIVNAPAITMVLRKHIYSICLTMSAYPLCYFVFPIAIGAFLILWFLTIDPASGQKLWVKFLNNKESRQI
jgi:hypothetical protein